MSIRSDRERLIFALDATDSMDDALSWVMRLREQVGMFKVGKESFTRYGPALVKEIRDRGCKVFLDLKFHDIPRTVAGAAEAAVDLGVAMFNVHALGGRAMLREAAVAVKKRAEDMQVLPPLLLAVTVLTSLDSRDLAALGFRLPVEETVLNLSRLAQDEGLSGVVASPRDIAAIRAACGAEFAIVTPGIRGRELEGDDQKRTLAAREAVKMGADYLVVGRPIRYAADPVSEAAHILEEMSLAC